MTDPFRQQISVPSLWNGNTAANDTVYVRWISEQSVKRHQKIVNFRVWAIIFLICIDCIPTVSYYSHRGRQQHSKWSHLFTRQSVNRGFTVSCGCASHVFLNALSSQELFIRYKWTPITRWNSSTAARFAATELILSVAADSRRCHRFSVCEHRRSRC